MLHPPSKFQKFGGNTVIVPRIRRVNPKHKSVHCALVACKCGALKTVDLHDLRAGLRQRCRRCPRKSPPTRPRLLSVKETLGDVPHIRAKDAKPEWMSWTGMKLRCTSKNHNKFPIYGGRGIKVCAEWLEPSTGFSRFVADMGRKPASDWTLERIDVDGDYEPANCIWLELHKQGWNKRNSVYVEYEGRSWCIGELAQHLNLCHSTLYNRAVNRGWPQERWAEPVRTTSKNS